MKCADRSRNLLGCGLLILAGLITSSLASAVEPAKSQKTELAKTEYPTGYVTQVFRTEIPAKAQAPLHTHPGIESGYILEGGGTLYIDGRAPIEMKPGMTTIVQPNTQHWFKNGDHKTVIVSTYVFEKDKPLMNIIKQ
ncbi:cupin domain-containing protein [Pseudomonas sp.]|uniref:cupin domain-containing protein n=1 Tax=Pseudomonas sp. TaxID=306 RepID=UPI0028AEFDE1|nr:cupin domain-containing protein [Pseudomonas sp.]